MIYVSDTQGVALCYYIKGFQPFRNLPTVTGFLIFFMNFCIFETNEFYVYPKLGIGGTSFDAGWTRADLKEKNTNIQSRVGYSKGNYGLVKNFILAPSVSFGYKLSRRLFLNTDIMLSYFRPNFRFEKEFRNLYTNESTVEYFDYKKDIFTLSLGAGFIFVLH